MASFDLAIYNSSIHYSTDYRRTLSEARRCLRSSGQVVIVDSPVYKRPEHGEQMRAERHELFERQYGFRSDSLSRASSIFDEADARIARLRVEYRMAPQHGRGTGLGWALRPWKARLLSQASAVAVPDSCGQVSRFDDYSPAPACRASEESPFSAGDSLDCRGSRRQRGLRHRRWQSRSATRCARSTES